MKVRWTRSSVRLRITPSELASLVRGEPIHETLTLPGGAWSVNITPDASAKLDFRNGELQLGLSTADVARLAVPETEGVYFRLDEPVGVEQGETNLRYYIEKDFPCAHPRAGEAEEPITETFIPSSGSPPLLT